MRVAIGSDHAGFQLKERLKEVLAADGHEVVDYGTTSTDSVDYPDYAAKVGHEVEAGRADRGILVCMTGIGMNIAANKMKGIRAGLAINPEEVGYTRKHNDANVLTFGARYTRPEDAATMARIFLDTDFEGGRHQRRVDKITALENEASQPGGTVA
jgi:ribose 5-phosphate isomerase B